MTISLSRISKAVMVAVTILVASVARALPVSVFAENSVLSSGRWVKIAVSHTGMHLLSAADLRSMGFSDPSRVGVFGYGGVRQSDVLSAETIVDDLPRVAAMVTQRGLVFFANGPEGWRVSPASTGGEWMEHVINPYTETCYYYLTEVDSANEPAGEGMAGTAGATTVATSFIERLWHEQDLVTIHETGHNLYGEDFRFNNCRTFAFNLTDRVEGTDVWMSTRFMAMCPSASSTVSYSANGVSLKGDSFDTIRKTSGSYNYADTCLSRKVFEMTGDKLNLEVTFKAVGTVRLAHLDRIDINYTRKLSLPAVGTLFFSTMADGLVLDGVGDGRGLHVWDVTDPLAVGEMKVDVSGGKASWRSESSGRRTYIAWREEASMQTPVMSGVVSSQNIHGSETPDMVIVTISALRSQAERIAGLHRNNADSLSVLVVTAEEVYNEFSSGVADVGAFRRMAKMFYDRGKGQGIDGGSRLRYMMLIGRPTYDHRRKTSALANVKTETLPVWQTESAISDNTSYSSDDIIGMLAGGSGANMASASIDIAVGRLPVGSASEANVYVDKLSTYMNNPPAGDWQNKLLLIADDQDSGEHMLQAELLEQQLLKCEGGDRIKISKLYIDAFPKINGQVPLAREAMLRQWDDGVFWLHYIGHASHNSWSHERLLVSTDIDKMYTRRPPIIFAATCDYGRWDSSETCGAEAMLLTEGGGTVAICTPTRPVYISQNRNMTSNVGATLMRRHADGSLLTVGEVVRHTKNYTYTSASGRPSSDSNRLRYVLFGDPALPMVIPASSVVIEAINGVGVETQAADDQEPATVMAHQHASVSGRIVDPSGELIDDFDGSLILTLYDAEYSTTSSGRGDDDNPGKEVTFEQTGDMLFTGRGTVEKGRFEMTVAMPSDVTQNYRNAAVSVVATADDGRRAVGMNRNFYVYGYDETAAADTVPPVIESIYVNHSSFKNGDTVNDSPMLLADVSDNVGINLSTAGIGHRMSLRLDGNKSYNDVSQFFSSYDDGTPGGAIAYPMENIADGAHTLTLTVWDTSNNPSTASVEFFVDSSALPKVFDVYTDTNPASTEARFYVEHNRPDASLTVTVEVFNLNGQRQWSSTSTGRSDMFVSSPVVWDLTDMTGRRVPRGIYIYRASLSADGGETFVSESRRLAVTAR